MISTTLECTRLGVKHILSVDKLAKTGGEVVGLNASTWIKTDGSWGINTCFLFFFFFFFLKARVPWNLISLLRKIWGKRGRIYWFLKGGGGISELVAIKRKYSPLPVEGRGNKERRNSENIEGSEVFMAKRQGYRSSYNIKGTGLLSALSITRLSNFRHTPW